MANETYDNLPLLDRISEALIEYELVHEALVRNGARVDEVVTFLSENGFGDEANPGRVARAAERLVNEGKMIKKGETLNLAPTAEGEVAQLENLMRRLSPHSTERSSREGGTTLGEL